MPEVVLVQGMAVADYLMPAVAELGRWTRAHLVELPGLAASAPAGRYQELPGAHTFLWADPVSWSTPVRQLACEAA